MTRPEQKKGEISCITKYLRLRGFQYEEEELRNRQECPDFKLTITGKLVGIEIREYYLDESDTKGSMASRCDTFVQEIRKRLHEAGKFRDLWVNFVFRTEKKVPKFEEELACFLHRFSREPGNSRLARFHSGDSSLKDYPGLSKALKTISIFRYNKPYEPSWTCDDAISIGYDPRQISRIIDEKNRKLKKFNIVDCQEVWLLIVATNRVITADLGPLNSDLSFAENSPIKSALEQSSFHRLILFTLARKDITEIGSDGTVEYFPAKND